MATEELVLEPDIALEAVPVGFRAGHSAAQNVEKRYRNYREAARARDGKPKGTYALALGAVEHGGGGDWPPLESSSQYMVDLPSGLQTQSLVQAPQAFMGLQQPPVQQVIKFKIDEQQVAVPIEIVDRGGGGDCLFHVIKYALDSYLAKNPRMAADNWLNYKQSTKKVQYLREIAKRELEWQIRTITQEYFPDATKFIEEQVYPYTAPMLHSSHWGQRGHIQAIANHFNIQCVVFTRVSDMILQKQIVKSKTNNAGPNMTIFIYNDSQTHFQQIIILEQSGMLFNKLEYLGHMRYGDQIFENKLNVVFVQKELIPYSLGLLTDGDELLQNVDNSRL